MRMKLYRVEKRYEPITVAPEPRCPSHDSVVVRAESMQAAIAKITVLRKGERIVAVSEIDGAYID